MSQFETDRENEAVGPEICEDCLHPIRLHGPDGCEHERGDSDETGCALGPCGCSAATLPEPPAFPSPLLAKHRLDTSWDEL